MQLEMANFSPDELDQTTLFYVRLVSLPLLGELDETYKSSLILAHSLHYVKTWRHPQNWKCIAYCTAIRGELSHEVTSREILANFGCVVFEICKRRVEQSDRQTDRQRQTS